VESSGGVPPPRVRRRARRRPVGPRAGGVPAWVPLLGLLAAILWLVSRLQTDSESEGFAEIDPRRTRIEGLTGFVDDRWRPALAARLAALPSIDSPDPEAVEPIRIALAGLPFVAEVGEGSVIWPDGYEVLVRLRKPVACVRAGSGYLAVAEDGMLLPGEWLRPPWVSGGWLPVLGPLEDPPRGVDAAARPGQRISERRHKDALSVAASMRAALAPEDFQTMGAPVIDASHASQASVADPGVVLTLENGRTVWFGRMPDCGEPGELPAALKWSALARALKAVRPTTADPRDWSLLDVRWDVPDIRWREAETAGLRGN